ncbi:MAG TPA: hypothetical protein VGG42_11565 [Acidobacteriaceae bacterium]
MFPRPAALFLSVVILSEAKDLVFPRLAAVFLSVVILSKAKDLVFPRPAALFLSVVILSEAKDLVFLALRHYSFPFVILSKAKDLVFPRLEPNHDRLHIRATNPGAPSLSPRAFRGDRVGSPKSHPSPDLKGTASAVP